MTVKIVFCYKNTMLLVCSSWYVLVAYLMRAFTIRDNMPLLLRQHTT